LLPPGRVNPPGGSFRRTGVIRKAREKCLELPTKPFWGTRETALKQTGDKFLHIRRRQRRPEAHMNHSIHSADRATHLKIVVVALMAGIAVAGFGISARSNSDYTQTAHVVKAGKAITVTSSDVSLVH